jgi:hypothetical protein
MVGETGLSVGMGVGSTDGIGEGPRLSITDGLAARPLVVGDTDGLVVGIKVGSLDKGVGCSVVGSAVGVVLGIVEGDLLGELVGTIVGEGVVGDGVLIGVGKDVGAGVGAQVVRSRDTYFAIPPITHPDRKVFYFSKPTGGVLPHLPVLSSMAAKRVPTVITQYSL